MPYVIPRETRPAIIHAASLTATTTIGAILLTWYVTEHGKTRQILFGGIILAAIVGATACVLRRQRRILDQLDAIETANTRLNTRLDSIDRQFEHVRMTYVADEIDPNVINLDDWRDK